MMLYNSHSSHIESYSYKQNNATIDSWLEVDKTDFAPIVERLCFASPDGEGWSKEKADFAVEEYRRFLKLNSKYSDTRIVPNRMVDVVWHSHILDTRKYFEDCKRIFGRFLHHFPYFGLRGDAKERDEAFEVALTLYKREFGCEPRLNDYSRVQNPFSGWESKGLSAAGCDAADISASGCDAADISASGCDKGDIKYGEKAN